MLATVLALGAVPCVDQGPWPCNEQGCPATEVSCNILVAWCKTGTFGRIFQSVPPGVQPDTRVDRACPRTCENCLQNVTFVNGLEDTELALFYQGNRDGGGHQAAYRPIAPRGGHRVLQALPGLRLALSRAGTLGPLVEHVVREGVLRVIVTEASLSQPELA